MTQYVNENFEAHKLLFNGYAGDKIEAHLKEHDIDYVAELRIIVDIVSQEELRRIHFALLGRHITIDLFTDVWLGNFYIVSVELNQIKNMVEATFQIGCPANKIEAAKKDILDKLKDIVLELKSMVRADISWYYTLGRGDVTNQKLIEIINEEIHDEAYPSIGNVDQFVEDYLKSPSSVLLLTGPPGTGKTRLIRYIVMKHGMMTNVSPKVMYTSCPITVEKEEFYINLRTGGNDFLILEDLDENLAPREEGNKAMHRLLSASDGFLRADWNKIILSTNLPMSRIDSALIRIGRCFAHKELAALNVKEARNLLKVLDADKVNEVTGKLTVADIYRIAEQRLDRIDGNRQIGFASSEPINV